MTDEAHDDAAEFAEGDRIEDGVVAEDDLDDAAEGEDVLLLAEHDAELVLPVWEPTGEPRVDAALDLITLLDPDDVHAHAAVFDDIHQQLRATLTDLDTAP